MINELANWMITMLMTKIGWKLNNNNSILKWYGSRFCFFSSLYFCLFVQLDISSFPVIFFCCLLVRFFNWKWKRKSNSEKTWLNKNVPYCLSKRIFCFFGCWWWYSLKTKNKIKNPDFQKKTFWSTILVNSLIHPFLIPMDFVDVILLITSSIESITWNTNK